MGGVVARMVEREREREKKYAYKMLFGEPERKITWETRFR
jgi:hypothetical protein